MANYLKTLLFLKRLPKRHEKTIEQLLGKAVMTEHGQTIYIDKDSKAKLAEEFFYSVSYVESCIFELNKADILQRWKRGMYIFNPDLFGINKIDIENINLTIEYTANGLDLSIQTKAS